MKTVTSIFDYKCKNHEFYFEDLFETVQVCIHCGKKEVVSNETFGIATPNVHYYKNDEKQMELKRKRQKEATQKRIEQLLERDMIYSSLR